MEPQPPSRLLIRVWAACRVLWIACLPLLTGVLLVLGGISELRRGRSGLVMIGMGLLGLALAWFAARHTWLVLASRRAATETGLAGEVLATGAGLTALVLLYLIVTPYFSGLFRKSAEGAMKNRLLELRRNVERGRDARGGRAPDSLEELGPIPDLWARAAEIPHPGRAAAAVVASTAAADTGVWAYVVSPSSPALTGAVFIDCTHTDSKGSAWNAY